MYWLLSIRSDQSLSRVWLFATPWIAARQASLSITNSWNSLRLTSIESVMPSSHLILCHPLLLLPPIPPSIRVLSNESTLRMRFSIVTFNVFGLFMLFMTFILEEYRIIIFYIIPQFWCMSLHCYSEIIHFILRYMSVHHIRNHTMSVCLMAVDAKFDNLRWYLSHF